MSALVGAYEQLLLDNISTVNTVESTIRNVTWFLPGRFADAEIASEGLYALLSVVSSTHDALLQRRIPETLSLPPHPFVPDELPPPASVFDAPSQPPSKTAPLLPPASEHQRYTRWWTRNSTAYRRASRALATVGYVELLVEMVARRKAGDHARWNVVLGMEGLKTLLRLFILMLTRRPVLTPVTPQREFDIASIPQWRLEKRGSNESDDAEKPADGAHEPEETRTPVVPLLGTRAPLRTHLYPLVNSLPESHRAHPLSLLPELHGKEYLAEVMSSCAVLVQVLLLLRAAQAPNASAYKRYSLATLSRNLSPFLLPLGIQLLARRMRAPVADSTLLAEHYAQLDRRIGSRFFLQGPMWIGWTRPKAVKFIRFLERIPLIGLAGGLLEGYLPLVDEYFYMIP